MTGLRHCLALTIYLALMPVPIFSKTIFVSTSLGDDNNSGSEISPLKSIDLAIQKADSVRLKAGDIFYGSYILNKKYLGRYGEGENPKVCGYRRLVIPKWIQVEPNIWSLSLIEDNYTGCVVQEPSLLNNIGCIHEYDTDLIHGRKVKLYSQLKENWDMWQTDSYSTTMDPNSLNNLYLYYSGNPNKLQLEFAIGTYAFQIRYSTIENVNIEGYGFGVSILLGDCVVRNCRIDAIGGMVLLSQSAYALEGNGISLYFGSYSVKDCLIEGNYISRCYDCGLCVQGTGNNGSNASNIILRDNLITQCCQGIENFSESKTYFFDNCIACGNYFVANGESGFGYPIERFKHCQILENNTKGPKGFKYVENLFVDGNFYCAATYEKNNYESSVFTNNECYMAPGQYVISDYYGKEDVIRVLNNGLLNRSKNKILIKSYSSMTKDSSTNFHIINCERLEKKSRKVIRDYLKYHSY